MMTTDDPRAAGSNVKTAGPVTSLALKPVVDAAPPRIGRDIGAGLPVGTGGPLAGEIIRVLGRGSGRTETAAKP